MQNMLELFKQIGLSQYYIDKYAGLHDILNDQEAQKMFIAEKLAQMEHLTKTYSSDEARIFMEAQIDRIDGIVNADAKKHAQAVAIIDQYMEKAAAALLS